MPSTSNALDERLKFISAKFEAAKGIGVSGNVVSGTSASEPVPAVKRLSILLTPYSIGKSGQSISGDSIPYYSADSYGDTTSKGGILGNIVKRLGPLGQREFPVFSEGSIKPSEPVSKTTSGNTVFHSNFKSRNKNQKLNDYFSSR